MATQVFGPGLITSTVSFTPTGSWTTNTTYYGRVTRLNDSIFVQMLIVLAGAPDTATLTINPPTGFTLDETKMIGIGGTTSPAQYIGFAAALDSGTATRGNGIIRYDLTNNNFNVFFCTTNPNIGTTVTQASPQTWASGDALWATYWAPIVI